MSRPIKGACNVSVTIESSGYLEAKAHKGSLYLSIIDLPIAGETLVPTYGANGTGDAETLDLSCVLEIELVLLLVKRLVSDCRSHLLMIMKGNVTIVLDTSVVSD